jgi:hypothetical protein
MALTAVDPFKLFPSADYRIVQGRIDQVETGHTMHDLPGTAPKDTKTIILFLEAAHRP